MKPFILLQSRPEDVASDNEYEAFWQLGRVPAERIVRVRMDQGEFPKLTLSDYSGVLMGGGPANIAYGDSKKSAMQKAFEPWLFALINEIIATDTPFLGTCLGFGSLVKAAGGTVSFDFGEPVEAVEVIQTAEGLQDPLLKGLPTLFPAFVGHKEGVGEVPKGAVELARSANCSQMIRVGKNVYATQFHPELNGPGLALRIQTYKSAGYFPAEEADALVTMALAAEVEYPVRILQTFFERYAE